MSAALRAKIAAIIRADLAEEAAAGFPLLRRLPDSETASVPDAFLAMNEAERESLLDALAHYSTVKWSHEVVKEKQAHPVLGRYLYRGHKFGPGDPYGRERPSKSLLRSLVTAKLAAAGFTRQKGRPNILEFGWAAGPPGSRLYVDLDPGLLRQMDYGLKDWMHADLIEHFDAQGPRDFVPVIRNLSYEHLWDGHGVSGTVCWDFMTESTAEAYIDLLPEILRRLVALAERINALSGSELADP
jgi:hypothetical protein